MAEPKGFEPSISCVTGRRFKPAKLWLQTLGLYSGLYDALV